MAKKITLKELAAMTGTSVSTVSKALNQSTEISESTRRRIVEVARASHYQFGKQSLPEERQKIVGFLVPDVSNPYFARLWRGVEDIAKAHDYSVVACHTGENSELEVEQLMRIQRLDVAGLLAVPVREENFHNIQIPFLFLSRCGASYNSVSYVINNDFRGAYLAAIFCMIGHSRPIFFGFKGGKGVLVGAGAALATEPLVCAVLLAIFLIEVAVTRIVSLGSIIIAALYPVGTLINLIARGANLPTILFSTICCVIMAAMVIWLHRSNIERLKNGTEYRFGQKK